MAKKMNKNQIEFLNFIKNNPKLTRTETYWKFREQGGKIKKQTALEMIRDYTKVEKRQSVGKTVGKMVKERRTRQRLIIEEINRKSLDSPIIRKLHDNIQKLYNHDEDQRTFLKVGVKNTNDEYSQVKDFNIFIPTKTDKIGVRTLSNQIIKNMKTYYKNLAKMYSNKNNVLGSTISALENINQEIKEINNLTKEEMFRTYNKYGIEITGYEIFEFMETSPE